MSLFIETETCVIAKHGEEACGDTLRIQRSSARFLAILSDGLGSGVRASVSSTLTVEILSRMIAADISLEECIRTVAATLPPQQPSGSAYSTFLVIDIDRRSGDTVALNFGNPRLLRFSHKSLVDLPHTVLPIGGHEVHQHRFILESGDVLVAMSDGIPGAGADSRYNEAWSLDRIAKRIEQILLLRGNDTRQIGKELSGETLRAYNQTPGDDASFIVLKARHGKHLTVFTGPPVDPATDDSFAGTFVREEGRKAVCGGTTGTLVSIHLGSMPRPIPETAFDGLPPISRIEGVDLTTEGLLTLSRATEYLVSSQGNASRLPETRSGAGLLAQELLSADSILFIVGLADNAAYAQLHLPSSSLFRKSVIRQMEEILKGYGKEVTTTYC
jgi:hypothetical protein